jgi:hypothetical protein
MHHLITFFFFTVEWFPEELRQDLLAAILAPQMTRQ